MKHAAWNKTIQRAFAGETVAVFGIGDLLATWRSSLRPRWVPDRGLSRAARIRRRLAQGLDATTTSTAADGCHRGAASSGGAAVILVTAPAACEGEATSGSLR